MALGNTSFQLFNNTVIVNDRGSSVGGDVMGGRWFIRSLYNLTIAVYYSASVLLHSNVAGAMAGGLAGGAQSLAGLAGIQLGFYWLANLMLVVLGLHLMNAWRGLAWLEQGGRLLWQDRKSVV